MEGGLRYRPFHRGQHHQGQGGQGGYTDGPPGRRGRDRRPGRAGHQRGQGQRADGAGPDQPRQGRFQEGTAQHRQGPVHGQDLDPELHQQLHHRGPERATVGPDHRWQHSHRQAHAHHRQEGDEQEGLRQGCRAGQRQHQHHQGCGPGVPGDPLGTDEVQVQLHLGRVPRSQCERGQGQHGPGLQRAEVQGVRQVNQVGPEDRLRGGDNHRGL